MHANSSSSLRTENPQDHPEMILKENPEDQTVLRGNVSIQALDSSPCGGRGGSGRQYRVARRKISRLPGNNINLNIRRSHSGARSSSIKSQHGLNTKYKENILIGRCPASLVDSTRPQRSATSTYDWDQNLLPTSATDLPVVNQENEARNLPNGHNHG
ncbi:OLC1v1005793C1 [Oldenlandia corymbosa var. corymbosa]|uniref:OLC1v1005793C1 n=1 Tax=Oldenlandia corymbosa var. corymbosa TaxID=529605 RepID=A0AAV1DFF3_OLDCO|nr:OLC1v1005793C1 [Oldenlandia corymbosa var. corymbosa]